MNRSLWDQEILAMEGAELQEMLWEIYEHVNALDEEWNDTADFCSRVFDNRGIPCPDPEETS